MPDPSDPRYSKWQVIVASLQKQGASLSEAKAKADRAIEDNPEPLNAKSEAKHKRLKKLRSKQKGK